MLRFRFSISTSVVPALLVGFILAVLAPPVTQAQSGPLIVYATYCLRNPQQRPTRNDLHDHNGWGRFRRGSV